MSRIPGPSNLRRISPVLLRFTRLMLLRKCGLGIEGRLRILTMGSRMEYMLTPMVMCGQVVGTGYMFGVLKAFSWGRFSWERRVTTWHLSLVAFLSSVTLSSGLWKTSKRRGERYVVTLEFVD